MAGLLNRVTSALAPRYRVLRELGSGGMATVYLAEDLKHQRKVAAKVLRPDLAATLGPERFLREIAIAAGLQHPHILPLHDSGESAGFLYYVMPFVEGESVRQRLAREGPLPVPEAARLLREVLDALAYAHGHGIVHRDIKPENVMLSGRHALVADFGVAKAVSEAGPSERLTTVGVAIGTPAYMAPEQAAADPATDHRADIYAAGVLAYEMLTGRLPFMGTTPQSVLAAQLTGSPTPIESVRSGIPPRFATLVMRCLESDPAARWQSAEPILGELESMFTPGEGTPPGGLPALQGGRAGLRIAWSTGIAVLVVLGALGIVSAVRGRQGAEVRWVTDSAIPAIRRYADSGQVDSAFLLALRARERAPRMDSALGKAWVEFTSQATIHSRPDSAVVAWAPYGDSSPTWIPLGLTPLDSIRLPRTARLKLEKDGYRPLEMVVWTSVWRHRSEPYLLTPVTTPDDGMVTFPAESIEIYLVGLDHLPAVALGRFRIGRTEVTNREFMRFVESGGYRRRELWDQPIVLDGRAVSWDSAMARFVDRTGRPGPSTWEAGVHLSGQAHHPVSGVSWYEAAAYARLVGKSLPTVYHWNSAATTPLAWVLAPHSNFSGKGPAPVGSYPSPGFNGVRDMAGNVREWCSTRTGGSRYVLGGGWSDPAYAFTDAYAQPPGDRSPINGIRLAEYDQADTSVALADQPIETAFRDYTKERPVPDALFASYRRQFDYDQRPLEPVVEAVDSSAEHWIREKIVVDAAYGDERLPLYLFLPRGGTPPYQAVVYFPGSNALQDRSAESALQTGAFDFVLKSGRAVIYPVYQGTYERGDGTLTDVADETNRYREHVIMWGKDLRRAVDYLESRPDILHKVGYYGVSWGGAMGGIWPAIEPRLQASVLLVAGLMFTRSQPEADVINYLPRVRSPVLMLNGRYDFFFPVETAQVPMFRMLGTPPEHKRQVVSDGGHFVPRTQLITETLAWLDRYLGTVERRER